MTLTTRIILWIIRLVAAVLLLQTLYFKFTAQPESVYIFTTVGMEPWGRIGSGIAELIASILLLITRTARAGAILALAVMAVAIFFHLTQLGIEVQNDGGLLFTMALIVASCSALSLYLQRNTL